MSTSFYGLHIAKSGLFASQKGLEVVANNMANAKTKGYTRQNLDLSSIPPISGNSIVSSVSNSNVGGGVRIDNVVQHRDIFLDMQFRRENSSLGEWQIKADVLYSVEDLFNNPDVGIDSALNTFFSTLEELSKAPESEEVRALVRQNAIVVTETMHYYSSQLESIQNQQNHAISVTVDNINNLINKINDLNEQIIKYERTGSNANELRDKRNVAIDELSYIVDITYSEDSRGLVTVSFGSNNETLVDGNGVYELGLLKDMPDYFGNADSFYSIELPSGGKLSLSDLNGGSLKGYLDMRDGDTGENMGIPYFLNKLDNLAKGIVEAVNSVHSKGYTFPSDSNAYTSETGINFFDMGCLSAKTMCLDSKILDSAMNIAASSEEIVGGLNSGNNENVLNLLKIVNKKDIPVISNIEQYLKSLISDVAVHTSYSNGRLENEMILLDNIAYKRESVSGVSIDEELTNMVAYEKSYNAASRIITAIDQMLDTLINNTGVVGR